MNAVGFVQEELQLDRYVVEDSKVGQKKLVTRLPQDGVYRLEVAGVLDGVITELGEFRISSVNVKRVSLCLRLFACLSFFLSLSLSLSLSPPPPSLSLCVSLYTRRCVRDCMCEDVYVAVVAVVVCVSA